MSQEQMLRLRILGRLALAVEGRASAWPPGLCWLPWRTGWTMPRPCPMESPVLGQALPYSYAVQCQFANQTFISGAVLFQLSTETMLG